jgi:hypothetical protein
MDGGTRLALVRRELSRNDIFCELKGDNGLLVFISC